MARTPDYSPIPVQRQVFTETVPIADFQARVEKPGEDD